MISFQLWTPQNVIIFNLASSDFAISVLGNPVTLAAAITKGWIFGHTLCVIYGFFMALLGNIHLFVITLTSKIIRFLLLNKIMCMKLNNIKHKNIEFLVHKHNVG